MITSETMDYIFVAIIAMSACLFGFFACNSVWKGEMIERGYAEYNQTTGDWQWREDIIIIKTTRRSMGVSYE